jgi:hypothetical protein
MLRDHPIHHNLIVQGAVVAERSEAVESNDGRALLIVRVRGWPGRPPHAIAVSPSIWARRRAPVTPAQSLAEVRESLPSKYSLHRDVWTPINRKHNLRVNCGYVNSRTGGPRGSKEERREPFPDRNGGLSSRCVSCVLSVVLPASRPDTSLKVHREDCTALRPEPQRQFREAGLLRCSLECSTHLSTRRRGK